MPSDSNVPTYVANPKTSPPAKREAHQHIQHIPVSSPELECALPGIGGCAVLCCAGECGESHAGGGLFLQTTSYPAHSPAFAFI